MEGVLNAISKNYTLFTTFTGKNMDAVKEEPIKLIRSLTEIVYEQYKSRFRPDMTLEQKTLFERSILLGVIDYTWINHIDAMSKLRNGIYLRSYAQKDPLQEYTDEGFYMFEQMTKSISEDISRNLVRMGIAPGKEEEKGIPAVQIELEFKA